VEAITSHDANSKWALATVLEQYVSAEARASAIIKQEEDLTVRACQVNQRAQDVEELERQLLEWEGQELEQEELDYITLRRELEVLSTHESTLERHEANLDQEQNTLEDAHAQVLARVLNANSWEVSLRDQEARLVAR
jgi:tRNA U34 5-carboxymethylaminomethyl modifying GTPase MnmE/TrmE